MKLGKLLPEIKHESQDCDIFVEVQGLRYQVSNAVKEHVPLIPGKRNIVLFIEIPDEETEKQDVPTETEIFEQPQVKVARKGKTK